MPSRVTPLVATPQFEVRFGAIETQLRMAGDHCVLEVPSPLLGGTMLEAYELGDGKASWLADQLLFLENDSQVVGAAVIPYSKTFQVDITELYTRVLREVQQRGFHLHRVWNFVPHINCCQSGLEKYREFNLGRWEAFREVFGEQDCQRMPAASAVGLDHDQYVLFFIAGVERPLNLENPTQVPAYQYPAQYGPKPPGFARASVVHYPKASWGYVSGTASITGHATVGQGDWRCQFDTTMENIHCMLGRMEMQPDLSPLPEAWQNLRDWPLATLRDWRCYLRHPEMYPVIRDWLLTEFHVPIEKLTFQLADICRSDLDLEFELTLIQLPRSES